MRFIRIRFLPLFLIISAIIVTVTMTKGPLPIDAKGLPEPLFQSPVGGGGGSGGAPSFPPDTAIPTQARQVTTDPTNSQGVSVFVPAGAVDVVAQLEVFRNIPQNIPLPGGQVGTVSLPQLTPPPTYEQSSDEEVRRWTRRGHTST